MSGRYDIEDYINDFLSKFKGQLTTAINNVNTDKGDTLLSTVSDQAYFYKKASATTKACDVFVYYEPYE